MIKLIIAGLLVVSAQAQASSQFEKSQELCVLQSYEHDGYEENFKELSSLDIDTITEVSSDVLKMINLHLQKQQYAEADLTLAQVKELFLTGEQEYNDLYILTFQSLASGRTYTQVKSYPGDNPYALIFSLPTQTLVATSSDDSIAILDGDKEVYCPWE